MNHLPVKRFTLMAGLAAATVLTGCAVYPDGTPVYGGGYDGYEQTYPAYGYGGAPAPQANVYLGFGNYSGPGYYDRGNYNNHGYYGQGRPPPPQAGRPRGGGPPSADGGTRPGGGGGPPPQAGGPGGDHGGGHPPPQAGGNNSAHSGGNADNTARGSGRGGNRPSGTMSWQDRR
ncbi:hypothetical protein [Paraburkholderia gardini]|nr:hypothetical protein [Paraburkholderia gardini]